MVSSVRVYCKIFLPIELVIFCFATAGDGTMSAVVRSTLAGDSDLSARQGGNDAPEARLGTERSTYRYTRTVS